MKWVRSVFTAVFDSTQFSSPITLCILLESFTLAESAVTVPVRVAYWSSKA